MSLSLIAASLVRVAEEGGEHAVNAWWIGLITLALLLGMLGALVAFGGGREHS